MSVPLPASGIASGRVASGFSLVELMLVLAVLAVLAAIAVPSYEALMRNARLSTTSGELFAALFHARSEAIRRGRRATLCTSADGESCTAGIGWEPGWILFDDENGNGQRDAGEELVHVTGARSDRLAIRGNDPVRNYVSYVPSGVTRTASGALQMGTLTVCDRGLARKIVISATGRPRMVEGAECND